MNSVTRESMPQLAEPLPTDNRLIAPHKEGRELSVVLENQGPVLGRAPRIEKIGEARAPLSSSRSLARCEAHG
jgi:hypothetical protein